MAFQNKNLSVIAYANGWTLWHYNGTDESVENLRKDDFFEPLDKLGYNGDLIVVTSKTGTNILQINITNDDVVCTKPMGF